MKGSVNTFLHIIIATAVSIMASYFIATDNVVIGILIIFGVIGFFIVCVIVYDFGVGVYILFLMGTFMFYITRIITVPIPLGVVYDALVIVTFICVLLDKKKPKEWSSLKNTFTYFFIIITAYQILQLFNPSAVSMNGWLVSMRNNTSLLLYIIFFQLFTSIKSIRWFTIFWLGLAFIVAIYGMYQEIFGLTDFEWRWIYEDPVRYQLFYQWGSLRKFSFLPDPTNYGMLLAFSGLAFVSLIFGPYRIQIKFVFAVLALITFIAMTNSGTRTATAMVAVGFLLLILLHIKSKKVVFFAMVVVFTGGIYVFGPFYSATAIRIRSTFTPSEDPSMGVRDYKRMAFRNYIYSHPIGGGLLTTGTSGVIYSPGHPLAGGWDPDSGYLATALELGWIGLTIFTAFFASVMVVGIKNHFSISNPVLRNLNLVYIVSFFSLSVGHFTQHAMFLKPVILIVIATYALIIRLPQFDKLNSDTIHLKL